MGYSASPDSLALFTYRGYKIRREKWYTEILQEIELYYIFRNP